MGGGEAVENRRHPQLGRLNRRACGRGWDGESHAERRRLDSRRVVRKGRVKVSRAVLGEWRGGESSAPPTGPAESSQGARVAVDGRESHINNAARASRIVRKGWVGVAGAALGGGERDGERDNHTCGTTWSEPCIATLLGASIVMRCPIGTGSVMACPGIAMPCPPAMAGAGIAMPGTAIVGACITIPGIAMACPGIVMHCPGINPPIGP